VSLSPPAEALSQVPEPASGEILSQVPRRMPDRLGRLRDENHEPERPENRDATFRLYAELNDFLLPALWVKWELRPALAFGDQRVAFFHPLGANTVPESSALDGLGWQSYGGSSAAGQAIRLEEVLG
jgi:hypothetical protein